jgi:3-methyladenine DNA glycosylase AlkD
VSASRALVSAVRRELAAQGEPERALRMQAYMKSALPFRGVTQPVHRETAKAVFLAHPLRGFEQWRDTILALWRGARFREERYAAIALAADKAYRVHALSVDALPVYDELIAEGAWWDYVDWTAIRLVGPLLREHPRELKPVVRRWSSDANLWRRRASIICQIGAKGGDRLPPARRVHPREHRRPRVLRSQGDWLGAARALEDRR